MAAGARAGETYGLNRGVLHQGSSDFETSIKKQREYTFRERVLAHSFAHSASYQFRRAGMRGMGFDNHGVPSGEGGSGVSAGDRKRDGEIAGGKNGDRAEGAHHGTNVGPRQRLALRQG